VTHPKEAEETTPPLRAGGGRRRWRGSGPPPAKRTTAAKLLRTRPDASTSRAGATHIRARPKRHPRVRGCLWALGGRWARPAHTSGGEWPHEGRTARNPPPFRHEGMRVREGVRPRQTAPRASDATQSGCLRNDMRRVPACPRDVGAGEHPHLATDCIHTRALALGARAGKLFRPRPAKCADRIAVTCHATASGE